MKYKFTTLVFLLSLPLVSLGAVNGEIKVENILVTTSTVYVYTDSAIPITCRNGGGFSASTKSFNSKTFALYKTNNPIFDDMYKTLLFALIGKDKIYFYCEYSSTFAYPIVKNVFLKGR